jgi:molybdate transport system substrate-binding protein
VLARLSPALIAFGGSAVLLAGLISALYYISDSPNALDRSPPLELYCAAAMRLPIEAIAIDYEKEFGQKVIMHSGPSQTILANLDVARKGDLFLPADESYIELAKIKDLIANVDPVARMKAVVIVRPGFSSEIKTWGDFLAAKKIGLANPEAAAIGMLLKQHLERIDKWNDLAAKKPTYLGDVNLVGNSVANVGSSDVGITWDALALDLQQKKPGLKIVKLDELTPVEARVQIAIAKTSKQPDNALRFVGFLCDRQESAAHLEKFGYTVDKAKKVEPIVKKQEDKPKVTPVPVENPKTPPVAKNSNGPRELTIYSGSMLQPAIEQALIEFEKEENCKIIRVYNGCGILVSQMKGGQMPDLYFACDTSFMTMVKEKFEDPVAVSNNQLMIAVKKGNPHQVTKLLDLAKPGIKVGVGHEHQCALGALTKETFIRTGVYAKVVKNIAVQSPSGDLLINQLRAGGLDVVVAYRSNVLPYSDIEGTPITGIPCATPSQPVAVSKSSTDPELSRRLMDFLQSDESRKRFESSGFGWELKKN